MVTAPRPALLDLLVVGGLTVDRFADGTSAPGGSVLHATRAAVKRGVRVGAITASGPEAEAQVGLAELRGLAATLEATPHSATSTFRHRDSPEGRRLWLEKAGGPITLDRSAPERIRTRAILYAPVTDEIDTDALLVWDDNPVRGAVLQGWLRTNVEGEEVAARPLSTLVRPLRDALATFGLLVASREDLIAEADSAADQLTALRAAFGENPVLVVTDGADGLWLDHPRLWREHLPARQRVEEVATVGAGDILAAFLTMDSHVPLGGWRAHAERAMRVVAEELEARRTA